MKGTRLLHLSFLAGLLGLLVMLTGMSGRYLFDRPIKPIPVLGFVAVLVSLFAYTRNAFRTVKEKGYPVFLGLLILLGPWSYPAFLALPDRRSPNPASRKREMIVAASIFVAMLAVYSLHQNGYRIYGRPYLYAVDPPTHEGWIRVTEIRKDGSFYLEDSRVVEMTPYVFVDAVLSLPDEKLSRYLFNVSSDDLYFRTERQIDGSYLWNVRVGDEIIYDGLPRYFPPRIYGYYESELITRLNTFEINSPAIELPPGIELVD